MNSIVLGDKWRIDADTYSWVLVFSENRTRTKKGTEETEDYLFEDKWYYPNIKQAINRFIEEDCKECKSIEELSIKLDKIKEAIDKLKNTTFKPDEHGSN